MGSVGKDTFKMYSVTENRIHGKYVVSNIFHYIIQSRVTYSEYLDYFQIELHFINVGMLQSNPVY